MLFASGMPTNAQKNRARRVLVGFKRASSSCFGFGFGSSDRSARSSQLVAGCSWSLVAGRWSSVVERTSTPAPSRIWI
jgi:hypothetical protein